MKNVSAFVVLGAFIISVVLTGCADLDNALSSLKVDQQKDSLTEDIDRAKTVKKLSYLTDSASRTLRSSEQGDADTIATATPTVSIHLAAGTDVDAKNQWRATPLLKAPREGHKAISELLINNGQI